MTRELWAKMSTTRKQTKVATLCGWKYSVYGDWRDLHWKDTRCDKDSLFYWNSTPPNYLHDLNAMRKVESTMNDEQIMKYRDRLMGVANGFDSYKALCKYLDGHPNEWHAWHRETATAAQRAEAFVLTMEGIE